MWRSPALMPIIREVLKKLEFKQQIVFGSLLVIGDNAIGEVKLNFSQNRKDGTNSKKLNGTFGDKLVAIKRYYQSI
jgi:ABC-type methionine transport system ATPase subunit